MAATVGWPREEWGFNPGRFSELRPGCFDVHQRVRDMNVNGVLASMCFPTMAGFNARTFTEAGDKEVAHVALVEHPGPKGQAILKGRDEPVWFSSARDAIAFTRLPDEPKDIAASCLRQPDGVRGRAELPGAGDVAEGVAAAQVLLVVPDPVGDEMVSYTAVFNRMVSEVTP